MRIAALAGIGIFLAGCSPAEVNWDEEVAREGAYLQAPFAKQNPPKLSLRRFDSKSNVSVLIAQQTSVKSQQSRGTCSIFSATALLESMLAMRGDFTVSELDLSEEWLQYVVTRGRTEDGSTTSANLRTLRDHGTVSETTLPYIGDKWNDASFGLAAERCGGLAGIDLASCLIGHWNPALFLASDEDLAASNPILLAARREAQAFRDSYLSDMRANYVDWVSDEAQIKQLLRGGIPMTLDIDFYYGAWNHRLAEKLGMPRDMDAWSRGVIGYPEPGSIDREKSAAPEDRAGHSIVVVGYDDTVEVKTLSLFTEQYVDEKGETQTRSVSREFTYRGVYYFKNSWGTGQFGSQFGLDGASYPGYGMITQQYAHEYGTFYSLPIRIGR